MTKRQKERLARKNAEKDGKRRTYTLAEIERIKSDIRKQEQEINARLQAEADGLEEKWASWTDYYNRYTAPRLCVGFYWAALDIIRKYLVKDAARTYMDELAVKMQEVVDKCGETDCEAFEFYKQDLERQGYSTPEWAEASEWEESQDVL